MSRAIPTFDKSAAPARARLAIAASRFNEHVVDRLLAGCRQRLTELGISDRRIEVYRVPGAFELPLAAQVLARTRRFDAIICLGAVIRGETPHFDYVAAEAARGIAAVALGENLPVIFGVLTTNNERQAIDRCGGRRGHAGMRAAEAAIEMIAMVRRARRR